MVGFNEPNRGLATELRDAGFEVHLIGDVLGRSNMRSAIHAGALLGRAL